MSKGTSKWFGFGWHRGRIDEGSIVAGGVRLRLTAVLPAPGRLAATLRPNRPYRRDRVGEELACMAASGVVDCPVSGRFGNTLFVIRHTASWRRATYVPGSAS